jgi:hypothetical protein
MTARPIRRDEKDLSEICKAIQQLQQGRSNAHGTFTLDDDGVATSTAVTSINCGENSHVSIAPTNAFAAAMLAAAAGIYVVAANGSFTVHHGTTTDECTFTYAING